MMKLVDPFHPHGERQVDPRIFDPSMDQVRMDEITDHYRTSRRGLASITYLIKGTPVLLYRIGDLAWMLGRESVTVRKWERLGYLPHTPYTFPRKGGGANRLYSEAMIMGIVRIAREENILIQYTPEAVNITKTRFKPKVRALFDELAANPVHQQAA